MTYQYVKDQNGNQRTDMILQINGSFQSFVPKDPKNKDWKAYQVWLAAGNTPAAAS